MSQALNDDVLRLRSFYVGTSTRMKLHVSTRCAIKIQLLLHGVLTSKGEWRTFGSRHGSVDQTMDSQPCGPQFESPPLSVAILGKALNVDSLVPRRGLKAVGLRIFFFFFFFYY